MLRSVLSFVRRLFGVTQLQRQVSLFESRSKAFQRNYISQVNANAYQFESPAILEKSVLWQRTKQLISLLSPLDLDGARYVRIGKNYDGGYVMVDHFPDSFVAAYSFGISNDVSWDEQMADRGLPVYMYDHTIKTLPKNNSRFHFFKNGVCGFQKLPLLKTLSECLRDNGHAGSRDLILKMDIEGCEWDVFDEAATETIGQFSQIVIELHGLMGAVSDPNQFEKVESILKKINITHQSVHVHANGTSPVVQMKSLVLPDLLEVTYVRRSDFEKRLIPNQRIFPTALDQPTFSGWPDIFLGAFSGV